MRTRSTSLFSGSTGSISLEEHREHHLPGKHREHSLRGEHKQHHFRKRGELIRVRLFTIMPHWLKLLSNVARELDFP